MDGTPIFMLQCGMADHPHLHIAAPHVGDLGQVLTPQAIEQGDRLAGLQAQHLNMAGCGRRQGQGVTRDQGQIAEKTRHQTRPKA